jgi:tetratricopeptide (TPR) repeat protein
MDSLAIALVHLDNEKEAIAWLKKAAKQNYVPSLGNLGDVYCQAEDYKNAEKWYSRAVKAGDKEFLINLGIVYLIRGSSNEAEKCFWEAAKYDMRKSYYLLGFLEVMKYNYPQAIKYFKKSLDRNKYFKSAYVLGLIYHDFLKDRKLAEKYYEEAIKHGIYYARPRLAWLLFQKGEKERSRMMIREAIKYSEKYDQGGVDFFFYSKVFIGMKRTKEALLMLKEAKKAYPGSVAIRQGLGDIYFLIGKYREAKKEYLKALEFNKKGCTFDKNQTEDLIRKCLNQVDEKLRH